MSSISQLYWVLEITSHGLVFFFTPVSLGEVKHTGTTGVCVFRTHDSSIAAGLSDLTRSSNTTNVYIHILFACLKCVFSPPSVYLVFTKWQPFQGL